MKKIIIIGGGFAGLSAAKKLCRIRNKLAITLIDKKPTSDFLPMLPDIIGRDIRPEALSFPIQGFCQTLGINFVNEAVASLDLENKRVSTDKNQYEYDYLIIASGSQTTFYGKHELKTCAYTLDCVEDAKKLRTQLQQNRSNTYIVCGGGYTGIDVATSLQRYLNKHSKEKNIIIVEASPSILGPLPEWMKQSVLNNLRRLNIKILNNHTVEKVEGDNVFISGEKTYQNAMLIWVAGVKTPDYVQKLNTEKDNKGRLKVDRYLRINESCFAIGDCANFSCKNQSLRMAVQFSIHQGSFAAQNIIRSIAGKKLRKYRPLDLGYIIPLANNYSCGKVLGINIKGRLPTLLHFIMSIYRSWGLRNKLMVLRDLV
ncbi:MAG: FAD-dependent oxidoreductase [Candidatus Omnitrophota bacterium]|nr:MAG: FAD-dependent oxidoreductase [Candidatus Omnitrophota bacterium]